MDLISIIIPIYNVEATLKKCLDSIANQSYKNIEVLLIDDGSKDNSGNICDEYSRNDSRFRVIHLNNGGVSNARNTGIKESNGRFIMFVDSDDIVDKQFIEKMTIKINEGYDLVTCGYVNFQSNSKTFIPENKEYKRKNEYIEDLQNRLLFNQVWNKIYLSSIIKNNNIMFDRSISIAEDWKFNIEYLKYIDKYTVCCSYLYHYRITKNGLGFKYNKGVNEIKLDLTRRMKEYFFQDSGSEYISRCFIKQYYSYFSNIFDKRNDKSYKEKKQQIKNIMNSDSFNKDISSCKVSGFKYKVLLRFLVLKRISYIIVLSKIANIYDKINKNRIYGLK